MTKLRAENIQAGYLKNIIINNLSITIPEGQIVGLIGPNGSGKSTLLKTLVRIIQPQSGAVFLDEEHLKNISTKEIAQKMALLAQSGESALGLTIYDIVSFGRYPYQKGFRPLSKTDLAEIDWALAATNLTHLANQRVDSLSGGQKQRVFIAMALAQDTDIVILDEPTTYLDPAHQLEILNLLVKINQEKKKTIILSIHDLNLASRFCDYLFALKAGQLVFEGTPEQVLTVEHLRTLFDIEALLATYPNTQKPLLVSYELRGTADET
ncbi:MAG: ABC transporter ATP-binding protein [Enterococcus sp.]